MHLSRSNSSIHRWKHFASSCPGYSCTCIPHNSHPAQMLLPTHSTTPALTCLTCSLEEAPTEAEAPNHPHLVQRVCPSCQGWGGHLALQLPCSVIPEFGSTSLASILLPGKGLWGFNAQAKLNKILMMERVSSIFVINMHSSTRWHRSSF